MKKIPAVWILAVTLLTGTLCWFLLPDCVNVQWSLTGEVTNTMGKTAAILVTYGVTGVCLGLSFLMKHYFRAYHPLLWEGTGSLWGKLAVGFFRWLGLLGVALQGIFLAMNG